jgi:hypothetical protein
MIRQNFFTTTCERHMPNDFLTCFTILMSIHVLLSGIVLHGTLFLEPWCGSKPMENGTWSTPVSLQKIFLTDLSVSLLFINSSISLTAS